MVVVAYRRVTELVTETLALIPRAVEWNLRVFSNQDSALDWLLARQDELVAARFHS